MSDNEVKAGHCEELSERLTVANQSSNQLGGCAVHLASMSFPKLFF